MTKNYLNMSTEYLDMDTADKLVAEHIQEYISKFDIEDTPANRVKIITHLQESLAVYEPFDYRTPTGLNRSTYKIALSMRKIQELYCSF
jgi:hypothetical protein